MSDRPDIPPEPGVLAAEYALGLLDPAARAAFEERMRDDDGLRTEVEAWEVHFATLAEAEVADAVPPATTLPAIEARLFGPAAGAVPRFRRGLAIWRGIAIGGLAMSAVLAMVLIWSGPADRGGGPAYVAQLDSQDSGFAFTAVLDRAGGNLSIIRAGGAAAPDRAQQVWAVRGDAAPVPLGLIAADGTARLTLPEALRPLLGELILAVSDEPPGGSPTGAPTGEILAAGPVTEI